jgi:hypothetical protein
LKLPELSKASPPERLELIIPVLQATEIDPSGLKVDLIPAQRHQFSDT